MRNQELIKSSSKATRSATSNFCVSVYFLCSSSSSYISEIATTSIILLIIIMVTLSAVTHLRWIRNGHPGSFYHCCTTPPPVVVTDFYSTTSQPPQPPHSPIKVPSSGQMCRHFYCGGCCHRLLPLLYFRMGTLKSSSLSHCNHNKLVIPFLV